MLSSKQNKDTCRLQPFAYGYIIRLMTFISTLLKFVLWWYSEGLIRLFNYLGAFFSYLMNLFSVRESIRHLFSPWKRLVSERRPGLDGFRDWLLDNTISRVVGLIMRLSLLIIFLISLLIWIVVAAFFIIIWLGWPILIPALFVRGVSGA